MTMTKSQRVQAARRRNALLVREMKDGKRCADCGIAYPWYVMQFDHVRGEKHFTLSSITKTNIGRARIMAEIEKCDLVCANCHATRTYGRGLGKRNDG